MTFTLQDLESLYVVEWSHSQGVFHIHTAFDSMQRNMASAINGKPSDWITVGYAESRKDAHKLRDKIGDAMQSRLHSDVQ